jgi:hypothetical protein
MDEHPLGENVLKKAADPDPEIRPHRGRKDEVLQDHTASPCFSNEGASAGECAV